MRSFAVRYVGFRDAISAACRRLVNAAGTNASGLAVRERLAGVLLGAPLIAAGAVALVLSAAGPASIVAAICGIFLSCWLAGLVVAQHGQERALGGLALVAAGGLCAALIAFGGGATSPLVLLLVALVFEPWWIWRTARAAKFGAACAVAAAAGAGVLSFMSPSGEAAVWYWLPALAYGLAVVARTVPAVADEPQQMPVETVLDATVLRLDASGEVVGVAGGGLGIAPELLVGQGFFERLHVGDRVAYMCALSDLRNGAANRAAELRIRFPNRGEELESYRLLLGEFVASGPEQPHCHLILRNGSEIERLRGELAAARDEMERLNVAKSRFLASVSHELRTPLNAIIGFSDMLLHELYGRFPDGRQKEHVGLIRDAGAHLLDVVNSILDVSKLELDAYEIYPEEFPFEEAIRTCASMMSVQAAAKDVSIETEIDPAIGLVNADRRGVQQMLINLLSNAIKFAPEGGRVRIESEMSGEDVEFKVRDNGIGIAETDLSRVGQPFVQVSSDYARRYEGTGLGLALVKGLVRLHGGSMNIASVLGGGTTVTIRLPKAGPSGSQAAADALQHGANGENDGSYRKTA